MRPSAAIRPAFLAALARPRLRSTSTACSIAPPVSWSAALQSIMGAPVRSRSSLTICAVILAMPRFLCAVPARHRKRRLETRETDNAAAFPKTARPKMTLALLCGQLFRLRDPSLHPAGQSDFLTDLVCGLGSQPRNLPIMENPEIVELLFDRGRDMVQRRKVVGDAAWPGEHLV